MNSLAIRSWNVSTHRLGELLDGRQLPFQISSAFHSPNEQASKIALANFLGPPIREYLADQGVAPLYQLCAEQRLSPGTPFIYEGQLFGKGFGLSNLTPNVSLATRKGELPEGKKLIIEFSTSGLVTDTAYTRMSGSTRLFTFCSIFQHDGNVIRAVPYLIGDVVQVFANRIALPFASSLRLAIEDVDQFKDIDFNWTPQKREFDQLRRVPEKVVKELLCQLLGEMTVPKDWGGEECDIFSNNLSIAGNRNSAAFLLKGPAKFKEMTLADCGKNGDQIYRLFSTPAEIYVIQHCHKIGPAVRKTVENATLAKFSTTCRYLFIDGYDTARILHAHGRLPTVVTQRRNRTKRTP